MVWHWRGSAAGPGERGRAGDSTEDFLRVVVEEKFDPVYRALEDLRYEIGSEWTTAGSIIDRAKRFLDEALKIPSKPSQAAGDTITSDQGVGTGEGEKVAQNGCDEARDVIEGVSNDGWRCPECGDVLDLPSSFADRTLVQKDGRLLELPAWWKLDDGSWSHAHGERTFPCTPPVLEAREVSVERILRDLVQVLDALKGEGGSLVSQQGQGMDGISALANFESIAREARKLLEEADNEATELCTPPAPPPSAEPAEETSSGGKSCEGDTARGARNCCLPMQIYRTVFPVPTRATIKKYPDDDGTELPTERFCRWCGTSLQVGS